MKKEIKQETLEMLMTIFINNLPPRESQPQRLIYHLRLAYFYYLDHLVPHHKRLTKLQEEQQQLQFVYALNDFLPEELRLFHHEIKSCLSNAGNIIKCGAIVSYQDPKQKQKRYLVIKDRRTGKYGFPKGKIAEGETIQECSIRETRQQTGYYFQCSQTVYTIYMFNSEFNFYVGEVHQIRAKREVCQAKNSEIAEILWVTKAWLLRGFYLNAPTTTVIQCINIFGIQPQK